MMKLGCVAGRELADVPIFLVGIQTPLGGEGEAAVVGLGEGVKG